MSITIQGAIFMGARSSEPSLTVWSRLEPLPTSADLLPGLQARVADPLWLIGRQWQFGELQGEEAGSPIDVRIEGEVVPLTSFSPGPLDEGSAARSRPFPAVGSALEVMVEREPARASNPRLAAEAGLHFLRCLTEEGAASQRAKYLTSPAFALDLPEDPTRDPQNAAWAALLSGRALDGRKLAAALRLHANANYELEKLPAEPKIAASLAARVRRAAGRWLRWYDESIVDPGEQPASWISARQEYAFAVGATLEEGPVVLVADEYRDGRLDWYSFRAHSEPALTPPEEARPAQQLELPPTLPVPVRYTGMAADRFWEFEDSRVNLGALKVGRTDLVQMLLIEFALAFGNDWFSVPLPLPVGSIFRMRRCTVRDTFGVVTEVGRSREDEGLPWSLFELSAAPGAPPHLRDLFFLAPTLAQPLASDPLEEVALFRDEMANLCWGVERTVQGAAGVKADRYLESSRTPLHQRLVDPPPDARLVYRLATPVPEYWIPLVPVRATVGTDPAGIELERRVLLRFDAAGEPRPVHPRGILLRSDPVGDPAAEAPLRLHEEEVPREGAVVDRSFQYARGPGGEAYLWLGRSKKVGKGEGSSLLKFDTVQRATR